MPGRVAALGPGGVNETFARAVSDFPELAPRVLSSDPWVVVFDKFLSLDEVEALKTGAQGVGFTQSVDAGKRLPDGRFEQIKSTARTSETAWLVEENAVVRRVADRIAAVSNVPYDNSEYLQVCEPTPPVLWPL